MTDMHDLAVHIESHGLDQVEDQVDRVVECARKAGVRLASVDVLASQAEPEVARVRAFGLVRRVLANRPLTTSTAA